MTSQVNRSRAVLARSRPVLARSRADLAGATLALALAASAIGGCGETASTGSFRGESHAVAQAIADLQSNVSARDEKKLCQNSLAAAVTMRLARAGGSCQTALKNQLLQIDATGVTIQSIAVHGNSARARVKSTYSGRNAITTLTLVKEGSRWKIAGAV
jgi:Putative lumazine-binding